MKSTKKMLSLLALSFIPFFVCGCQSRDVLQLREDNVTIELGEVVSVDVKDYLVEETTKEILDKTVLSSSLMEDEAYVVNDVDKTIVSAEKEFLSVGEYIFTLTYDESESKEVKVVVKDTTTPTFSEDFLKEIKVEQNAKDVDFNAFYQCDDLSGCKVETNKTSVDLSKTGEYTMKVAASDEYENKVEQDVKVIVVSMEEARKENGVTKTLDGKVYQSEALVKKLEEEKKAAEAKKNQNNSSNNHSNNSTTSNNNNKKPNGVNQGNNDKPVTKEECEALGGTYATIATGQKVCLVDNEKKESGYDRSIEKEIYNLVNQERAKAGLSQLRFDSSLQSFADMRAKEVIEEFKNNNVHHGMQVHDPKHTLGEIAFIGGGYGWSAKTVVDGWMNSKGHRDWILKKENTTATPSYYYDSVTRKVYSVVIFRYDKILTDCYEDVCTDYTVKRDDNGDDMLYCNNGVCNPYIKHCDKTNFCIYNYADGTSTGEKRDANGNIIEPTNVTKENGYCKYEYHDETGFHGYTFNCE